MGHRTPNNKEIESAVYTVTYFFFVTIRKLVSLGLEYRVVTNVRSCPEHVKMYEGPIAVSAVHTAISSATEPTVTAAEALQQISGWNDLDPIRRRDYASALNTACRWLGHPAGDVMLTPKVLRDNILERSAASFGVGVGRWKNIKSSLRVIMARLGLIDDAAAPVSGAWVSLLEPLDSRERPTLEALARFCDQHTVGPDGVSDGLLEAFELHLTARSLRPNPRKFVGEVRGCWNRAAKAVPGWPSGLSSRRPNPD